MLQMTFSLFEKIFNHTIQFDARTAKRLARLDGKSLSLEITDLGFRVKVFFTPKGIQLQAEKLKEGDDINKGMDINGVDIHKEDGIYKGDIHKTSYETEKHYEKKLETDVDVQVRSPLVALLAFINTKELKEAVKRGLVVEGDMEVANEIQHFVSDLDVDWEEMLSGCTGDIFAHQFFNFFRKAKEKRQKLSDSIAFSAGNFLQEELQLLPTETEVQDFNKSVEVLRDEVERLEAKIQLYLGNSP